MKRRLRGSPPDHTDPYGADTFVCARRSLADDLAS